ncbi:uncharacterized protein LOC113216781 [Frankliniella occidentalis]|uniref:Gustatory receptor n=1 Tax=Frankliniella occidentalis TaxID=133901 RepID=A0A6J1TI19_FRAOC|nr:uncharacterized protein LOC113216781 [Frankliniella occidentalis]
MKYYSKEYRPASPSWRAALCLGLLLGSLASLLGLLPLRGWPPRPWSGWAAYGVCLLVYAAVEVGLQCSFTLQLESHVVMGVIVLQGLLRGLVFAAAARRRALLGQFAECLVLYTARHPPAGWWPVVAMSLMVWPFWAVYGAYCGYEMYRREVSWDCCPWRAVVIVLVVAGESLVNSVAFLLVVAPMAALGVLAVGLRADCAAAASLAPGGASLDPRLRWRALRVRQQLLCDMHDMALALSEERSLLVLVNFSLNATLWYSDCAYMLSRPGGALSPLVPAVVAVCHQVFFAALCVASQRFHAESVRIGSLLLGHLAETVETKETSHEVSCFVDQVLRQSNSYSLLGVLDLNSSTLKSVFAAVTSYLVFMVQFDIKVQ